MTSTAHGRYEEYGHQFAAIYDDIFPREFVTDAEIQWLTQQLPPDLSTIIEFGVGTGRVAVPLKQALLKRGITPYYLGVDVSDEMLERLAENDPEQLVERLQADVTQTSYDIEADAILCVCATISMITTKEGQAAVFRQAADTLRAGGILLVETHNATVVQSMHPQPKVTYAVPYPGHQRALVTFSELAGVDWRVDHCWISDGSATFASESSRLTSLDELDEYARAAGLRPVSHTSGLAGAAITIGSPTVTAVYVKSPM
ncbi:class I SAM-dependent methyltransferase [Microbacterium lacticum]